jgi:hypothetical protein
MTKVSLAASSTTVGGSCRSHSNRSSPRLRSSERSGKSAETRIVGGNFGHEIRLRIIAVIYDLGTMITAFIIIVDSLQRVSTI